MGAPDVNRITREKAAAHLFDLGLSEIAGRLPSQLSGGEKQRACVARAMMNDPKVIFADEPTGNLDSNTGEIIEKMLFEMNANFGITLIVVTHDADLAAKCPRIIEMKDGEILNKDEG